MGREVGRDQGGDNAAWLDLVARLEMPAPIDPADAPWPERESLPGADTPGQPGSGSPGASPAGTNSGSTAGGHGSSVTSPSPADRADPASQTSDGQQDTQDTRSRAANSGPDQATTANHGRLIRPATFTRYSELADEASVSGRELSPEPGPTSGPAHSSDDGYLDAPTSPDLGFLDFLDYEDDPSNPENRYVPPPPPPMPKLDPVVQGAWLALFGGPGYLLLATILGWDMSGWAELLAIAAFVTGFIVLVTKLGDGPSRRDGPDQGAVV